MKDRVYLGSLAGAHQSEGATPACEELMREGLAFIGFGDLVSSGTRVFVKPNLTFPTYRPGTARTTKS